MRMGSGGSILRRFTGTPPFALVAMSKNQVRFEDVLVGDVWLASGQSNMEYCLRGVHNIKEISDHLEDQQLRIFMADHAYALEPASDVRGHWEVASRESLSGFSAIAYFFGHDLRQSLNRPIGLVESSFGGTIARSWTSISGLEKDPPFAAEVAAHAAAMAKFQSLSAGYGEKRVNYQKVIDDWDATDGEALNRAWAEWRRQAQINRIAGKPVPRDPEPGHPRPPEPADPLGGRNLPGSLFNGMIAPLIPFAMKGVIWHQGEFNADRAVEYRTLFPRLISDWREKWGQGDFPFLFVQLAALGDREVIGGGDWPLLQEAQFIASRVPNTGIATSIDIGDRNDIHPADKLDVGLRLAHRAASRLRAEYCRFRPGFRKDEHRGARRPNHFHGDWRRPRNRETHPGLRPTPIRFRHRSSSDLSSPAPTRNSRSRMPRSTATRSWFPARKCRIQ